MLIGIFCGGFSSEYDISIKSGKTIFDNFPKRYQAVMVYVKKDKWLVNFQNEQFELDLNTCSFRVENETIKIDAALIYVHGDPGENGKLQAYFDLIDVPVINAPMLQSAISFDKWFCNQFLKNFGVPMAASILLEKENDYRVDELIEKLSLPIFVKPCDSGSSYGISKVNTRNALAPAIEKAFEEGETVVCEAFMNGIEVTCGTYKLGKEMFTLPITEIVSETEFFDFEAKYLGKSKEITPARISEEVSLKVSNLSKRIYQLLQLKSLSRIDFMVVNDEPMLIEVNTTPGFSAASIVPQQLACAGISISDFWDKIILDRLGK